MQTPEHPMHTQMPTTLAAWPGSTVHGTNLVENPSSCHVSGLTSGPLADKIHSTSSDYVVNGRGQPLARHCNCVCPAQSDSATTTPSSILSSLNNRGTAEGYSLPSHHCSEFDAESVLPDVDTPSIVADADYLTTSVPQGDANGQLNRLCPHCGERSTRAPQDESRFSAGSVMGQPTNDVHRCGSSSCQEQLPSGRLLGNGAKRVEMTRNGALRSQIVPDKATLVEVNGNRAPQLGIVRNKATQVEMDGNQAQQVTMIESSTPLVHVEIGNPPANTSQSTQTDGELGRDLQLREVSKPMISSGVQTPLTTSTPSRMSALLNSKHSQVRSTDEERREKHDGNFKLLRKFSKKEISTAASSDRVNSVASDEDDPLRYSLPAVSHSPKSRRVRSTDTCMYTASSPRSPTHSHTHGTLSSDTSLSVHSSPAHRHTYSDARRASNPGLSATVHAKKPYRHPTLSRHKSRHLHVADPVELTTDSSSSSDSQDGGYHERTRHFIPGRSSGCVNCARATCDDRTPLAHMLPTKATCKYDASGRRESSEIFQHDHYSESDTSPEHHDTHILRHSKPQLVKVIKTPQLKEEKRVVYLASSSTSSSEELYYSEPGQLVKPKSTNQQKRVVSIARRASGNKTSRNRDDRLKEIHVRAVRPRKVYVKPAKPGKRVYIVEQNSGESESDLDQFEVSLTQGSRMYMK